MTDEDHSWLNDLNPQQRQAVTHGDGSLLIVAGAGTGKTKTLVNRLAYLISTGVPPDRIMLLTFTRRAANEMLERAASLVQMDRSSLNRVWGGTFHAVANRLLRTYGSTAQLAPDFNIIDRSDSEDLLELVRTELGLSATKRRFPRKSTCLDIYSRRINSSDGLEAVLKRDFPWCAEWTDELAQLFQAYVDRKQRSHLLDYDDLLLYWYYLAQDDEVSRLIGSRFDHILVDEYQDTNPLQAGLLIGMRRGSPNITVVGDDSQSIYGFRAATVRNMLDFPVHFPGARVVTLEQNYRSVGPILITANELISQAHERFSKDLWSLRTSDQRPQLVCCADEDQQNEAVISQVLEHYEQGILLRKQAVLFRAASHTASLEIALARRNIPFRKYGGLRFLEAAHVKDLLSFLRILENPRDQMAWSRVLQLLSGVGPISSASAFQHIARNKFSLSALCTFSPPPAARREMSELGVLFSELTESKGLSPSEQIERVMSFYGPILHRVYQDHWARTNDIEHLMHLAAGHDSLNEFLSGLVLDSPISTGDIAGRPHKDEDWLVLSTIHSAKGLEWDVVYLIHAADGFLPSDMATGSESEIEEELRLTYVAVTRARDFLYVLWPLRYYANQPNLSDRHTLAQLCRFFTPDVVNTMVETTSAGVNAGHDVEQRPSAELDIASKIRGLWD